MSQFTEEKSTKHPKNRPAPTFLAGPAVIQPKTIDFGHSVWLDENGGLHPDNPPWYLQELADRNEKTERWKRKDICYNRSLGNLINLSLLLVSRPDDAWKTPGPASDVFAYVNILTISRRVSLLICATVR